MSNETTLDDVLALVAKATPGPFDTGTKAPIGLSTPWDMVATDDGEPVAYCNYGPKDAAAIAAAINYLRAHGDELRAALEDARQWRRAQAAMRVVGQHDKPLSYGCSLLLASNCRDMNADRAEITLRDVQDEGVPVGSWRVTVEAIDAAQEVGK